MTRATFHCTAGHETKSPTLITECPVLVHGHPCTAEIKRGARRSPNRNTQPQETPTMPTTEVTPVFKNADKRTAKAPAKPKATAKKTPAKPAAPKVAKAKPAPKPEPVAVEAPVAGPGELVVKLRTARQTEILTGYVTGGVTVTGPYAVVTTAKAQAVYDEIKTGGKGAPIFDRRVLDYFTAVLALTRRSIKIGDSGAHNRLIAAARAATKDGTVTSFEFVMKLDGTLAVTLTADGTVHEFSTQRDALAWFPTAA